MLALLIDFRFLNKKIKIEIKMKFSTSNSKWLYNLIRAEEKKKWLDLAYPNQLSILLPVKTHNSFGMGLHTSQQFSILLM